MIDGKKVLAVIAARGGSKGLPGKNILPAAGKPLVCYTVEQALASRYVDRLIISSDAQQIIAAAVRSGCEAPFVRPTELAGDESSSADVLAHALGALPGYDFCVLLQPTTPLRKACDIDACLELIVRTHAPTCVSVTQATKTPYWMFSVDNGDEVRPLLGWKGLGLRRQDLPPVYYPNGAVYVVRTDWFMHIKRFYVQGTRAYRMPIERSLDIDCQQDFEVFKRIVEGS